MTYARISLFFLILIATHIPSVAHAALTYVGSVASSTDTNSTSYTLSFNGLSLQEGDLVIVATGFTIGSDDNPGVGTSGYTEVADLYADDFLDANFSVSWKVMGASPDSTVSCNNVVSSGWYPAVCIAYVWRGVDGTTPMDVTPTTATGINSALPDGPSITPTTEGAVVVTAGLGTVTDYSVSAPSGYGNAAIYTPCGSLYCQVTGIASKAWTSGAEDPPVWTDWAAGGELNSWNAVTLAIRPAAEGPDAPTNLTTTSATGGVSLSWTAPASSGGSNLETYGIWRATTPFTDTANATLIASIATTSTSYSDTSAVLRTNYYFGVTATNGSATSSLSNIRGSSANSGRVIRLGGLLYGS